MPRRAVAFFRKEKKTRPITGKASEKKPSGKISISYKTETEEYFGLHTPIVRGVVKKGGKVELLLGVYSNSLLNKIAGTKLPEEFVPVVFSVREKQLVKLPPEKTKGDAVRSAKAYAKALLSRGQP